jgi:hypothetical protein
MSGDGRAHHSSLKCVATWLSRLEPRLAVPRALTLLLYPNPLVILAAILGAAPSVARLVLTGRPWRRTAFDVPLAMLLVGAGLGASAGLYADGIPQRVYGLLAVLILYAAILEHGTTPARLRGIILALLGLTVVICLVLVNVVGPYLRLDRAPPLATFAAAIEPLGIVRPLLEDEGLLQRYRLYASGVGALAVVGLGLVAAILVGTRGWRGRRSMDPDRTVGRPRRGARALHHRPQRDPRTHDVRRRAALRRAGVGGRDGVHGWGEPGLAPSLAVESPTRHRPARSSTAWSGRSTRRAAAPVRRSCSCRAV